MESQLSLSARPKTFSTIVGQDRLLANIRKLVKKRMPRAWLFYGPKGSGKTTLARILAVSLQCTHQEKFGEPCLKCRKRYRRHELPIFELNCAFASGAMEIRQFVSKSDYDLHGSGYRVFILDEAHDLSSTAQDVMMKFLEDSPKQNIWIINTTRPDKINEPLRSRCIVKRLRPLDENDTLVLVKKLLKKVDSDLSSSALTDALIEAKIDSPRLICNAVEVYVAGASAEEAAEVEGFSSVNTKTLVRSVVKGDWPGIVTLLRKAPSSEARLLRAAVVGYLREILYESSDPNDERTKALYESIRTLTHSSYTEDANQIALLAAELCKLCKTFSNYRF